MHLSAFCLLNAALFSHWRDSLSSEFCAASHQYAGQEQPPSSARPQPNTPIKGHYHVPQHTGQSHTHHYTDPTSPPTLNPQASGGQASAHQPLYLAYIRVRNRSNPQSRIISSPDTHLRKPRAHAFEILGALRYVHTPCELQYSMPRMTSEPSTPPCALMCLQDGKAQTLMFKKYTLDDHVFHDNFDSSQAYMDNGHSHTTRRPTQRDLGSQQSTPTFTFIDNLEEVAVHFGMPGKRTSQGVIRVNE
ncbi:hypothetical protein CF327_g385 [Tilletia walkeri]|nr:hypothetical protein CF327_g385 [Tilletia walkeri]